MQVLISNLTHDIHHQLVFVLSKLIKVCTHTILLNQQRTAIYIFSTISFSCKEKQPFKSTYELKFFWIFFQKLSFGDLIPTEICLRGPYHSLITCNLKRKAPSRGVHEWIETTFEWREFWRNKSIIQKSLRKLISTTYTN